MGYEASAPSSDGHTALRTDRRHFREVTRRRCRDVKLKHHRGNIVVVLVGAGPIFARLAKSPAARAPSRPVPEPGMPLLTSRSFAGDALLEAAAADDLAAIREGASGPQVAKIQQAVGPYSGVPIDPREIAASTFGPSTAAAVRNFNFNNGLFNALGQFDGVVGRKTILYLDAFNDTGRAPPQKAFIIHDVRLFGWRPQGEVLEVNGDTPLDWVIANIKQKGAAARTNLVVKIMAHGLPGFVQFARGRFQHPTLAATVTDPAKGNLLIGPGKGGICRADLGDLAQVRGYVKRIEFHSCLVARIGTCFEANGHTCYDGNEFCYNLAQVTAAEVRASIHLQYYWNGSGPNNGMHFGDWNGQVFTWGPAGNIIHTHTYAYQEVNGPPPPGTTPT